MKGGRNPHCKTKEIPKPKSKPPKNQKTRSKEGSPYPGQNARHESPGGSPRKEEEKRAIKITKSLPHPEKPDYNRREGASLLFSPVRPRPTHHYQCDVI